MHNFRIVTFLEIVGSLLVCTVRLKSITVLTFLNVAALPVNFKRISLKLQIPHLLREFDRAEEVLIAVPQIFALFIALLKSAFGL